MTQALDVQTFLDERPFSAFQRRIFALCFGIVLLDGFDTGAVGFIAPSLAREWGVDKPTLAPVLTAALLGLAAGALVAGPAADRLGRKLVLTTAVLLFGTASLASAFATGVDQLALLRAVTGVGLGAALPNAVTLFNEYCPSPRRALLTNAMFCGFPLGAALGGFLAAWMIPTWGWRSVLLLGGIAPIALTLLIALFLPESVRYLLARLPERASVEARIRVILAHIDPRAAAHVSLRASTVVAEGPRGGLGVVFSRHYLLGSVMLWTAYFMGLAIFYGMINWLPLLLRESGMEARSATLVSSLFPLGGVGAVCAGWLMDRFEGNRVVAILYVLTAGSLYALGQATANVGLLVVVVFLAGVTMNTAQSSLPALAAAFYPTEGRATGVAWMMGIGRFGGIFGSFLVAELSRRKLDFGTLFAVLALPGVCAAGALALKHLSGRMRTARTTATRASRPAPAP